MDYTVHRILQARILEWVAFLFSRASFQPRDQTRSPALQADSLPAEPQRKPDNSLDLCKICKRQTPKLPKGGKIRVPTLPCFDHSEVQGDEQES